MDVFRNYVLSVICAALFCGILIDSTQNTFFKKQIQLVCTIFFLLSLITPWMNWQLPAFKTALSGIRESAEDAAEVGKQFKIRSLADIIKSETEAYILKEAASHEAVISVYVSVTGDNPPIPFEVILCGKFDASCEKLLSRIITQEFGIPKERQAWIRQDIHASGSS